MQKYMIIILALYKAIPPEKLNFFFGFPKANLKKLISIMISYFLRYPHFLDHSIRKNFQAKTEIPLHCVDELQLSLTFTAVWSMDTWLLHSTWRLNG